jgi:hypothetical protein
MIIGANITHIPATKFGLLEESVARQGKGLPRNKLSQHAVFLQNLSSG